MGLFGGYSYKNKKGEKYYLHFSEKKKVYYFSKDPVDSIDLPIGYEVVESPRTALPVLRKIGKK
ncbi:MAG: hypothetical protein QXM68_04030 [Candidatus Aenigmatarchaeota archaeon]|jgi:hypothetical protein|nr:hypothetical protein [Candidatus Aenigmarchaeota archaeon]MCX8178740.1 hypothetical protein [Candidatus Aenigmarchaeota archaeon]